ncbi:HAD-IIA family hydrolase [Propioniciclava sp. MC1595]|uniref:HAD-IIA family hydrolase n=1 Tax=Propioniciclava sp. MC1595 TaxID=2760308 RepID=UPI0016626146|nr:HAD-IIA family hydrolase [Propioniciclava sp. MC1595]MBB1495690.1 HAD-IIA family hydrolase [Propioniciclava sp. MC1595]NLE17059.1 HAD-IIA family hydrolase [Propioniciclava sp.]QTE24847.1 HAD-IIA family hydrolase [Propioniciclava sp. MC1595]
MTAFIEGYDAVFFDLDGVLYLGPEAVEGAVDGVRRLHEAGVATVYVTNNAARSTAVVAHHLAELGFGAQEQEVVSSAQAASGLLRQELPAGSKVLVAGTDNLVEQVRLAGMEVVTTFAEEPVAVIQGYDPAMTWPRLDQAAIAIQRGARWFATNTDSTRPTEHGLVPGAGAAIQAVRNTVDHDPEVVGKPFRPLMDEALRRSGAGRPVFVGDRIDTDIMGAHAVGIDSFLVFTGAHGVRDLCLAPVDGRPTAIGWNVESLFEPRRTAAIADGVATCGAVTVRAEAGNALLEGDVTKREAQLDAAWALAQLFWDGSVSTGEAVFARLDLLP